MPARLDLLGKRFSRLLVTGAGSRVGKKTQWKCTCDCGVEVSVTTTALTSQKTTSCGCWRREINRQLHTTHGGSYSAEYRIWAGTIQRCHTPSFRRYADYGGRGIQVCDRWRNDFPAFLADMGPMPSRQHSIERINNNGNYEPGNCRWATDLEQASNKRNNRYLTFNGRTQPLTVWAREVGLRHASLRERLDAGMSTEEALTKPSKPLLYEHNGIKLTAPEWADRLGLPRSTVRERLRTRPPSEALDVTQIRGYR